MTNIKAGDVVHLKHDPEVLFTVTEDLGAAGFIGMWRIVRFDKSKNNEVIELDAHKDSLIVVSSSI